jgi:hypothetical protein
MQLTCGRRVTATKRRTNFFSAQVSPVRGPLASAQMLPRSKMVNVAHGAMQQQNCGDEREAAGEQGFASQKSYWVAFPRNDSLRSEVRCLGRRKTGAANDSKINEFGERFTHVHHHSYIRESPGDDEGRALRHLRIVARHRVRMV